MAVGYCFCLGEVFKLHMLNKCLGLPSSLFHKRISRKKKMYVWGSALGLLGFWLIGNCCSAK